VRPNDAAWSESDWFGHCAGPIGQTLEPIKGGARFAEFSNSPKREHRGEGRWFHIGMGDRAVSADTKFRCNDG